MKDKLGQGKWIILSVVLVPILIAIGVVAGGYIFSDDPVSAFNLKKEEAQEVTIPLEEFLVNLGTEGSSRSQYLKLELSLSSQKEEAEGIIESNIAQVRDAVIFVIHKKTGDDLFSETDGAFALKEELKTTINATLDDEIVEEVFITNMLMQ